jgi:hypothetical protein
MHIVMNVRVSVRDGADGLLFCRAPYRVCSRFKATNLRADSRNYNRTKRFGGKREDGYWRVENPRRAVFEWWKNSFGFPCNFPAE